MTIIKNHKVPAFFFLSLPVFCLMLIILTKSVINVLQVQQQQTHYLENKKKLEKIKEGLLKYFQDKQHFPQVTASRINGEVDYIIDYESFISYYIPEIYRKDHKNQYFLVKLHHCKYHHPLQDISWNKELEEDNIYLIFTIYNPEKTLSLGIYENELLTRETTNSNKIITESKISPHSNKNPPLSHIAKLLNNRQIK